MRLVKQTKGQVIREVKEAGTWKGYIVGCKVAEPHIVGGWSLGFAVDLFWHETRGACVVGQEACEPPSYVHAPRTFQHLLNNWAFYNTNYERGYYAAYYKITG